MIKIAFVGKKGSGKTSAADSLHMVFGATRLSFATPLKMEVYDWLLKISDVAPGVREVINTLESLNIDWPALPLPPKGSQPSPAQKMYWINEHKLALRETLQKVGTDYYREMDSTHWIRQLAETLPPEKIPVCIDDCRFLNEAHALIDAGFTVVQIVRPGAEEDTHSSEDYSWLNEVPHTIVLNDSSYYDFHNRIIKACTPPKS